MVDKRTHISTWVFRITLALLAIGTMKYSHVMHQQMVPMLSAADERTYFTVVAGIVTAPLGLFATTLAMLFRSGAVVWLAGLQFVNFVVSMISYIPLSQHIGFIALLSLFLIICVAAPFFIFRYLISRGEIRTP